MKKHMNGAIVLTLLMTVWCAFSAGAATYVGKQRFIEFKNDSLMQLVEKRANSPEEMTAYLFGMTVEELLQAAKSQGISPEIMESTLYIAEDKFRLDAVAPMMGKASYLARLDESKMYAILWDKKQYMEMSFEEIEQMQQKAAQMRQNMLNNLPPEARAQLEKLPPELRAQMESQMGAEKEGKPIQVKKTGRVQTINGFRCEEYLVEGESREQVWATQKYPALRTSFEAMLTKLPNFDKSNRDAEKADIWQEIPEAWPVVMKTFRFNPMRRRGASLDIQEMVSMEEKPVPDDTFHRPEGFTKVTMQEMMGGMMQER